MSENREKRERKATVDVYVVDSPTKKEFVIPEGSGTKLGDIPNVDFALNKIKSDEEILKLVHRLFYRTPGKATVIKKNIRAFSGFPEDADRGKAKDVLDRAFAATLNAILDLFDLPRGVGEEGKKEAKVARLMAWLEKPSASDKKNLKEAAIAKREKATAKREKAAAKKEKAAAKKARAAAKKEKAGAAKSTALPSTAAAIKKELEAMAKKQAALLKKLEKAVEGGGEKRKAPPASKPTPGKRAKPEAEEEEREEAGMPTDEALEAAVKEMLEGSDVENISMKKVRADLEEKFGVPLVAKKNEIKGFVVKVVGE